MNWNNQKSCYVDKGVKQAYIDGTGNTAEINFILIAMLNTAGINANPVKKDTILSGIDQIKRSNFFIHSNSQNLIQELNSYVWKNDKNGNNLDEPEDRNNHLIDAIRYVLQMKMMRNTGVFVY